LFFTQRSGIGEYLADDPDLQFSGIEVNFTITSDSLSVIREDNGNVSKHFWTVILTEIRHQDKQCRW